MFLLCKNVFFLLSSLMGLGFELKASHLQSMCPDASATSPVHFALIIVEMGILQTICLGQPQPMILLISAS
jgi:hypothetical protein